MAEAIFKASTDNSGKLRYPVGPDATSLLLMRRGMPDGVYAKMIGGAIMK